MVRRHALFFFLYRINRPWIKRRFLIVFHAAKGFSHDPRKNKVHAIQHFCPAAEIPMKIDPSSFRSFLPILPVLFHKDFRPCQTEFIDALLHIPYHKPVKLSLFFPGNTFQQHLLHQIAVLVFIDQDLFKIIPVIQRRTARFISFPLPALSLFIRLSYKDG